MSDKVAVVESNRAAERDPFESFFHENYKRVYGLLYRLTGRKMDAEDLTVETFLRYLQDRPANLDEPTGWLFRVAMRLGLNSLRSSRRRTHYETRAGLYIAGSTSDPSREYEREQERAKVWETLRKMDPRTAQILLLHHSGCSYKEIAAAIDVSQTSVGTLISRAHKQFELLYEENNE